MEKEAVAGLMGAPEEEAVRGEQADQGEQGEQGEQDEWVQTFEKRGARRPG